MSASVILIELGIKNYIRACKEINNKFKHAPNSFFKSLKMKKNISNKSLKTQINMTFMPVMSVCKLLIFKDHKNGNHEVARTD